MLSVYCSLSDILVLRVFCFITGFMFVLLCFVVIFWSCLCCCALVPGTLAFYLLDP